MTTKLSWTRRTPRRGSAEHRQHVHERSPWPHRRNAANERHEPIDRRPYFASFAAEEVRGVAEELALRYARVPIDRCDEHTRTVGGDARPRAVEPHWSPNGYDLAIDHLERGQHVERTFDERRDVGWRDDAAPSRFGNEHCLPADERLAGERPSRVRCGGIDVGDDYVVQPERHDQFERRRVLSRAAASEPVTVRPKILVQIAAMQIDDDVRGGHDLTRHHGQRALRLRAIRVAGITAVH